jgi:phosphatidylserine/phosphatidylglycerophosphate/cardiolipin synthase-like enzyme
VTTLFGPVADAAALSVEMTPFDVPDTPSDPSPRFAGLPVLWLKIAPGTSLSSFVAGARQIFTVTGVPAGPTVPAALIEVTPMPYIGLLNRLPGGTPLQYVLLHASDLPAVADSDQQVSVAGGAPLLTAASEAWVGFVRQDRICRDPRGWVDDLEAAAAGDTDASWATYAVRVRDLVAPTVRLVDHTGRPLHAGSFTINTGSGPDQTVTLSDAGGDTGAVVTGAGHVRSADTTDVILASTSTDTGALGDAVPITPADRQLARLAIDDWIPPRHPPTVTGLGDRTVGNFVEPILDGLDYFARLVPDLRTAQHGGAVTLAGWAFVKGALADPTKVWTLLPHDDSTQLVTLVKDLIDGDAQVRLLINQFVQLSEAGVDSLTSDLVVILTLLMMLAEGLFAVGKLGLDPAWWIPAGFGLPALLALTPSTDLLAAIRYLAEPSDPAVSAINSDHPGTAVWTPYPATLADNPLAENPLSIAGVTIDALTHVGVYHEKIAAIQPAGQQSPLAYLGGIDINSDRLDNPVHRAAAPFHDVQVKLTGPAVADVLTSLADRAATVGADSPVTVPAAPIPPAGSHVVQVGRTRFAPGAGPGHGDPFGTAPHGEDTTHHTVLAAIDAARDYIYIEEQYFTPDTGYVDALVAAGAKTDPDDPTQPLIKALVVTLPAVPDQPYGGERRGEFINALQGSWGDRLWVGAPMRRYLNPTPEVSAGLGRMVLRDKLDLGADKAVVGPAERMPPPPFWAFAEAELIYVDGVVGPPGTGPVPGGFQDPDEPDSPDQTWQTISIQRAPFGQAPRWAAKPDNHDKNSCVLAVQIPGIYVHAKLMVIDDVFVSVGSSNLNRRGFMHDGEMNVFAVSEHLKRDPANPALRLRTQLWAEHLGLPPEMGLSLLADPLSALKFFGRSWYRGTHWQPLATFGDGTQPPVVALSVGSSAVSAAIGAIKDLVLVTDKTTIWATAVDPTTSLDPNTGPGDQGPNL